jgi:hypothetical protein
MDQISTSEKQKEERERALYNRLTAIGYVASIPFLTFVIFKILVLIQKFLYQGAEETLFSNGFLILHSLALSIYIPGLLILTLGRLFPTYWKHMTTKSLFGLRGRRFYYRLCMIVIPLFVLLSVLVLHSYVKITGSKLVISTPSIVFNEMARDYSNIETSDRFYIKFDDGTEISIKNILNNQELVRMIEEQKDKH